MNIAWTGELILLEAKWNDKDGHLAKFKLAHPDEDRPNPFKSYTKRRGGRAGTRFQAGMGSIQHPEFEYAGELMLAGWGDTSTHGYTVTFWCESPSKGIHILEGFTRGSDSFMVALAELDDDNEQVNQVQRERVENAMRPKRRQTLSQAAAMLCQNEDFWKWAGVESEEEATDWVRKTLNIQSRRQLDSDLELAQMYHDVIRRPFVRWNNG